MATKKVFTSLDFQSGAKLLKAKIDPQAAGDLSGADPTFGASAGQLAYGDDTNLYLGVGAEWKKLYRQGIAISTASVITSTLASDSGNAPPFVVASTDKVLNLNADQVDGSNTSNAVGNNTIPVRDSSSLFHVGASSYYTGTDFTAFDAVTATQVANKALVDAAVAKLVYSAPTALNTLDELAGALGDDAAFSTTITTALGNRLRIDVNNQGLTSTELTNARTNLGLGALATLSAVGASEITNGSVDTAELANDAVDADKLDDSASFTMGGLTVNGDIANTGNINSGGYLYLKSGGSAYGELGLDGNKPRLRAYGSSGWLNVITVDNNNGKLGLGADATSPSGTLHVSTARYGSDLISGWNFTNWGVSSSTYVTLFDSDTVVIGQANAWWRKDLGLTAEKQYVIRIVGTKSANVELNIRNYNGSALTGASAITGSGAFDSTQYITLASGNTGIMLQSTGNATYDITKLEIYEDFLSTSANLSVNSAADDLVIANNDDGGITLINPNNKKSQIFFADKNQTHAGGIIYDHGDANAFSITTGGGTAALTIDTSQNAKFEGGLGVGTTESAAGTITVKANGGRINVRSNDNLVGLLGNWGNSNSEDQNEGYLALYGAGAEKIRIAANYTSYFNGGNVAIGGTSAGRTLELHSSATGIPALRLNNTNSTADIGIASSDGAIMTGSSDDDLVIVRNGSYGVSVGTNGNNRFRIDSTGTQDHQANSIINSATVAGLQDSACYDFDGSADYIEGDDAGLPAGNTARTTSFWIRHNGTIDPYGAILNYGGTGTSLTAGSAWMVGWDDTNAKVIIGKYGGNASASSTTALTSAVWHHVAVTYDGTTVSYYLDGVADGTATFTADPNTIVGDSNNGKLRLGRSIARWGGGTQFFGGQIRDVKIFPSALTAADIRKLYSGENPKKNTNTPSAAFSALNGEDWSGASGGTPPTGWTEGVAGTFSVSAGELSIIKNANHSYIYQNFTVAVGEVYKISFRVKNVSASYIRVSIGSSSLGEEFGNTDHSSTSYTTYEKIVTATSTMISLYVQINTTTDGQSGVIDFLRVNEVETLVDFNPQSASTSTWRNEALLGYYDGTVNNATLSQGNSYWNNIKQDATDTTVSGELTVVPTASEKGVTIGDGTKGEVPLIFKGGSGSFSIGQNGTNFFLSETSTGNLDAGVRLSTTNSGNDIKIHNKLGVGTAASTYSLEVAGAGSQSISVKSTNSHAAVRIDRFDTSQDANLIFLTGGTNKWRLATGLVDNDERLSIYDDIADTNMMTFKSGAGVGIGNTTDPNKELEVGFTVNNSANINLNMGSSGNGVLIENKATNLGSYACLDFRANNADGRIAYTYDDGNTGAFHFVTDNANTMAPVFKIGADGTQDHKSSRTVNSQTVNDSWRTSEPSLRFDGVDDFVDLTSGGLSIWRQTVGSVSVWFKPEQVGSAADILHIDQSSYTDYWLLRQNAAGTIRCAGEDGNSSTGAIESTTAVVAGEWNHVVVTCAGTGSNQTKIYLNGVEEATATFTEWTGHLTALQSVWLGKSDWNEYKGEIRDLRWHNRALDADEVKGLYNGEATPWKYADTNPTSLAVASAANPDDESNSAGHFALRNNATVTSSGDSWTGRVGSYSIKAVITNTNSGVWGNKTGESGATGEAASSVAAGTLSKGRKYRLSYTLNNVDISANIVQELYTGTTSVESKTFSGTGVHTYSVEFTANGTSLYWALVTGDSGQSRTLYIDNWKLTEVGEVAAYTPQSINDKWYDETSNANHGTITGATTVGDIDHFGILTVKGRSVAGNRDINGSGCIKLGDTDSKLARFDYDSVGTTSLRIDNTKDNASAEIEFGLRTSGTRVTPLQLVGDGSVKARSADSSNLKQVARVEANQVTWPNATATTVAFRIDHGLGVDAPIVQVYEDAAPYGLVDVEVRQGDWIGADFGAVGTEQGASESAKDANRIRYVTVVMAANPGNATKWNYRVTG